MAPNRLRQIAADIDAQLAGAPADEERVRRASHRWWIPLATAVVMVTAVIVAAVAIDVGWINLITFVPVSLMASWLAFTGGFYFNNRLREQGRRSGGWWNSFHVLDR